MTNTNICHPLHMSNINKPFSTNHLCNKYTCYNVYIYIQARNAYIQNAGKEINTQVRLPKYLHNQSQRHHHKCLIYSTCNKLLSIIIKVIKSEYIHVSKMKNKSNTNNNFASFWMTPGMGHFGEG